MKLTIENTKLSFDLRELFESLTDEQRAEAGKLLIAERHLFNAVAECLADDSRFGHYFGDWSFDPEFVAELRAKLLPLMPQIARRTVEQLMVERDQAEADAERIRNWAWSMYHGWPEGSYATRPSMTAWTPGPSPKESDLPTIEALGGEK